MWKREFPGYLSVLVFLDGTGKHQSGGVRFWRNSTSVLVDVPTKPDPSQDDWENDRSLHRHLRACEMVDIEPVRGKMVVWDARLVHRAMPNNCAEWRAAVHFSAHPSVLPVLRDEETTDHAESHREHGSKAN